VHELGIALEIVDAACERAAGRRVTRVVLEVGMLTAVLPDALRFCFDAATEGTALEGAILEIVARPGVARCRACGVEFELMRAFGRCRCGGSALDWLAGEELRIREMEVA
jgi:hydrogenase nickel incorporation protein HypA/HybF